MTATQAAKSVEITRSGRAIGHATFTPFDAYGDTTVRYAITIDRATSDYFGAPEGEILGYVIPRKGRWEPIGCHDLQAATSLENLEMPTFLPTARNRSEAVEMLAKLRWAERHPDAPREPLRAAVWAGIRIPKRQLENA